MHPIIELLIWIFCGTLAAFALALLVGVAAELRRSRRSRSRTNGSYSRGDYGEVSPSGEKTASNEAYDLMGDPRDSFPVRIRDIGLLHIYSPTKAVSDRFSKTGSAIQRILKGTGSPEDVTELFALAADILSRNRERKSISAQQLSRLLDGVQVAEFLSAYLLWLTDLIHSKN